MFKRIPIKAAKEIADKYGYHQVIIIARAVGEGGGEHCTTYGANNEHCSIAARCGDFLKHKVMGWHAAAGAGRDVNPPVTQAVEEN
jgi:hypothetical protein